MVTKQGIHSLRELLNAESYKRVVQKAQNVHERPITNAQSDCSSVGGHKAVIHSEIISALKVFLASNSITGE